MLRSTVKNVTFRSVHGISSSYVFARLYSSQQTTNFYAHSQNVVTRSNSSAVSKDSHDQGKIALTSALRKSFISTGKNTRSEAERQDALFQQSFNNPAIHRLMSTAVIEDTFWTLIEGGDSFLVTKASGQIPDHFYSNSILNACILAFGRTNKPNKVKNISIMVNRCIRFAMMSIANSRLATIWGVETADKSRMLLRRRIADSRKIRWLPCGVGWQLLLNF